MDEKEKQHQSIPNRAGKTNPAREALRERYYGKRKRENEIVEDEDSRVNTERLNCKKTKKVVEKQSKKKPDAHSDRQTLEVVETLPSTPTRVSKAPEPSPAPVRSLKLTPRISIFSYFNVPPPSNFLISSVTAPIEFKTRSAIHLCPVYDAR